MDIRKLKALRNEVGISGLELARLSGINHSSISLFETGNAKVTERQLDAIRMALLTAIGLRISKLQSVVQKIERLKETDQTAGEGVGAHSSIGDGEPDAPGSDR